MHRREEEIAWKTGSHSVRIGLTHCGEGPGLLLLPALSSISTRSEMWPLQQRLANRHSTVAIDWPGFGDLPRPKIAWSPRHYQEFLRFVLETIIRPAVTIAAGHAASYALTQSAEQPASMGRLCLLSPTWRGPLPTMAKQRLTVFRTLAKVVDLPLLGTALYRLNVNRPVIGMMARAHVYADPSWLSANRVRVKRAVTEAPGARHASFRFVTGELDLFTNRQTFLETTRRAGDDILVLYGREVPPKSKAEMQALAELPNTTAAELPHGKLSFYEEFPEATAAMLEELL